MVLSNVIFYLLSRMAVARAPASYPPAKGNSEQPRWALGNGESCEAEL